MKLDKRSTFGLAAAIGANTGVRNVGDVIPLDVDRDIGAGEPLYLVVQIETTLDDTSGATATVQFQLVSDSTATIAIDGSQTVHWQSPVYNPADALKAGQTIAVIALPQGQKYEKFLGFQANVGGEALTAGKVNAFLVRDVANWVPYAGNSW